MNNLSSKKKLILSILLISILSFSSGAIFVSATTSIPPWTLNYPLPANADWYVAQYSNSSYYAVSDDGQSYYGPSTNASYIINSAIGALTAGRSSTETVYIKGSYSITNSIVITSNWTTLLIDGKIAAANSLNNAIIRNANPASSYYGITIKGIGSAVLDGNSGGQSNLLASGINFTRTGGAWTWNDAPYPAIIIENLFIHNCYSQGIYLNFDATADKGQVLLNNINLQANVGTDTTGFGGGQIVLYGVSDSQILDSFISGDNTNYAFLFLTCSAMKIDLNYLNGHGKMVNCNRIEFSSTYCDNSGNFDTIDLYHVYYSSFHSSIFNSLTGMTNNTYNAISLSGFSGNCTYNIFTDLVFTSFDTSTNCFKYGIEEKDNGQKYNVYSAINGAAGVTLRCLSNTTSKYDTGSIMGTIVTV